MHWFHRPPYLRWAAAALLVTVTLFIELRPEGSVLHPFAAADLTAGEGLDSAAIEWRPVPDGLLAPIDPAADRLTRPVAAGEPIAASAVGSAPPVPEGWWSVPLPLPSPVAVGGRVLVVITDPVETVPGVVVALPAADPLAYEPDGLIAVPTEAATRVALASAAGTAVVLVAP